MATLDFEAFFAKMNGGKTPYLWQQDLVHEEECKNRLIRIPTGFGKTLGVLSTWAWYRIHLQRNDWPRRLVWCLPMRVLVEQTVAEVCMALEHLGVLRDGQEQHDGKVGVYTLMGGSDVGDWYLYPERDAVLIGTQDMLLSRAMNRGYASPRARWPMEFGLLNQDTLWVMDEVQLMDVGFATSGQLQSFRDQYGKEGRMWRPCRTWWMSATLQHDWLKKSPDTAHLAAELSKNTIRIKPQERTGHLWDDVDKSLALESFTDLKSFAKSASKYHQERNLSEKGPTIVVLNTVDRAVDVWKALSSDRVLAQQNVDIRLLHSRFRPAERKSWSTEFLNRTVCQADDNRIIVSTQVIEAGVDISAPLLLTEVSPWPSLVQRFGRCARWGGKGRIVVADFADEKKSYPYSEDEIDAARQACRRIRNASPGHLERYEESNVDMVPRLYPYTPKHLLLLHELNEMFDTSPDLTGADIDISRFIRSDTRRDIQVFWMNSSESETAIKPIRDELCTVPFLKAQEWLCKQKSERLKPGIKAYVWSWLSRKWDIAGRSDIYPGQTILVGSSMGGYQKDRGWDMKSRKHVEPVKRVAYQYEMLPCWCKEGAKIAPGKRRGAKLRPDEYADAAEEDESLSMSPDKEHWQTIGIHGREVAAEVQQIAAQIVPDESSKLLHMAGRWHDLGKAHDAFQCSIRAVGRPKRRDIAKAPDIAWPCKPKDMYYVDDNFKQRRGSFRHELASTLGLFSVLQRHDRQHPALLGPWNDLFDAMKKDPVGNTQKLAPVAIEQEILDLTAEEFDLLAYLVCAHHGKVRMSWHSTQADQNAHDTKLRIHGIRNGDTLPPVKLASTSGALCPLPRTTLDLSPSEFGISLETGRSWIERILILVQRHGMFTLALLEALLRAADQRCSSRIATDSLLQEWDNNPQQEVEH